MERPSGRIIKAWVLSLLLALICACKRETPKDAYLAARNDADRNDVSAASMKVDAALNRFGTKDDEWVAALKILQGELLMKNGRRPEGLKILQQPLPAKYEHS